MDEGCFLTFYKVATCAAARANEGVAEGTARGCRIDISELPTVDGSKESVLFLLLRSFGRAPRYLC